MNLSTRLLCSLAIFGVGRYFLQLDWLRLTLAWLLFYVTVDVPLPFIRNVITARRMGFPTVWVPWFTHSLLWVVFQVPLRPVLRRNLPTFIWERLCLTIYGWEFQERRRPYDQYAAPQGDRRSFVLVTLGAPELWTYDPEIITHVLNNPKDFAVMDNTKLILNHFGENVLTSNGDHWSRQRKVIATTINERISKSVFNESIRQTEGMLSELFPDAEKRNSTVSETNRLFDMMKKLTVHVLSGAGMGEPVSWNNVEQAKAEDGFRTTYIDAVKTVITSVAGPLILPKWFIHHYPRFMPGHETMQKLSVAVDEFPRHTRSMLDLERERTSVAKDGAVRSNIMAQMLRASEGKATGKALTERELTGNLFIFTLAGFDTTSNTLCYAMMLLARYPKWQEWLFQEIDQLMPPNDEGSAPLEYADIYPKALRIQAFMLEVLRLFPPLVHIVKQVDSDQAIPTSHGTYWLPRGSIFFANSVASHLNPEVWRNLNIHAAEGDAPSDDDELHFRPTRWLNTTASEASTPLYQPVRGTYYPWSGGPRICPGMKMGQVEFATVMLTLLRRHRVDAVPRPNEDRAATHARLDAAMRHSISVATLQMEDVFDVEDDQKGFWMSVSSRTPSA